MVGFSVAIIVSPQLIQNMAVWASYLYTGEPYYYPAFGVNLAAGVAVMLLTTYTWLHLKRCNSKLEKGEAVYGVTDHQRERGFRFML